MFLKAHWDVIAAIDFTTVEVWTKNGLVTFYLLFAIDLKIRRIHFADNTTSPHVQWLQQAARALTNFEDGFLNDKQYIIMDRDTKVLRVVPIDSQELWCQGYGIDST